MLKHNFDILSSIINIAWFTLGNRDVEELTFNEMLEIELMIMQILRKS